uniref:Uncharacterized protein n=1 Tax=Panagrolaimus sp. JU765 TaxID=591449 RepID=A0AC34Q9X9_9BILA
MNRIKGVWEFDVKELSKSKCLTKEVKSNGRCFYLKAIVKRGMVSCGINADFVFKANGTLQIEKMKDIKYLPCHELDYGVYDMIDIKRLRKTCRLSYDLKVRYDCKDRRRRHSSRRSQSFHSKEALEPIVDLKTETYHRLGQKLKIVWPVPIQQIFEESFIQTEKEKLSEFPDTQWWIELHRKDSQWALRFYVEEPNAKLFGQFKTNLDPSDYNFEPVFRCPDGTCSVSSFLAICPERLSTERSGVFVISLRMTIEKNESATTAPDFQIMPLLAANQLEITRVALYGWTNGKNELVENIAEDDYCYQCFLRSKLGVFTTDGLLLPFSVGTIANILHFVRSGFLIPGRQCDHREFLDAIETFDITATEEHLQAIVFNHLKTMPVTSKTPFAVSSGAAASNSPEVPDSTCRNVCVKQEVVENF